jgi:hypothetical protein
MSDQTQDPERDERAGPVLCGAAFRARRFLHGVPGVTLRFTPGFLRTPRRGIHPPRHPATRSFMRQGIHRPGYECMIQGIDPSSRVTMRAATNRVLQTPPAGAKMKARGEARRATPGSDRLKSTRPERCAPHQYAPTAETPTHPQIVFIEPRPFEKQPRIGNSHGSEHHSFRNWMSPLNHVRWSSYIDM